MIVFVFVLSFVVAFVVVMFMAGRVIDRFGERFVTPKDARKSLAVRGYYGSRSHSALYQGHKGRFVARWWCMRRQTAELVAWLVARGVRVDPGKVGA